MQISDEQINRTAVLKRFGGKLDTVPYMLDIKGQIEWVENLIQFGDLVESHMGEDACIFYYEQLYELLLAVENNETDKPKIKEQSNGTVKGKRVRGDSKRLF